MIVGRNDPCPCGSGKKYKKCCMKKSNLIQFQELKEERFYRQKHVLVDRLGSFIHSHLSPNVYNQLESQFKKRTKHNLGDMEKGFFHFWLYFFYHYENGLRGIEWFLEENEHLLSEEEKVMARRWLELKPQLVQAIDETETAYIFQNYFTKKKYNISKFNENIPVFIPWYSTIALLEHFDGQHYFNGVRVLASPKGFQRGIHLVRDLVKETNGSENHVLFDYFPEIVAALLDDEELEDSQETHMTQYTYTFLLRDKVRAENFLYNDKDFSIEKWDENKKELTWLGEMRAYEDSELDGQVRIAEVLAILNLAGKKFTFTTLHLSIMSKFLRKLGKAGGAFELVEDHEESISVPVAAELRQMTASLDKGVPEYFAMYAQNDLSSELDEPIPKYNDYSLRELVKKGQEEKAEEWLKQSEFNLYKLMLEKYGQVDVTADFNTARRELGLSLSPFVTGGEKRQTKLVPLANTNQRPKVVLEEDIPIYNSLGFTPETIDNFYTDDIITFYKEKALGKSEGTARKYRNSLFYIREVLEKYSLEDWNDCNLQFWQRFLKKDFLEWNEAISKSMVKDMVSTISAFVKWLGREGSLNKGQVKRIVEWVKHDESSMLNAISLLEQENPYLGRAYYPEMNELGSILKTIGKGYEQVLEGQFKIISINKQSVRTENIENGNQLTISLSERTMNYAEKEMIFTGKLGKSNSQNTWKIIHLENITFQILG